MACGGFSILDASRCTEAPVAHAFFPWRPDAPLGVRQVKVPATDSERGVRCYREPLNPRLARESVVKGRVVDAVLAPTTFEFVVGVPPRNRILGQR